MYIYGKNPVRQLFLEHKEMKELVLAVNDKELESFAQRNHVRVRKTDKKNLTKITGTDRHQGVAAEVSDYKTYSLEEIMQVGNGKHGLLILLDELEDPHNLGAILRSADAIGACGRFDAYCCESFCWGY